MLIKNPRRSRPRPPATLQYILQCYSTQVVWYFYDTQAKQFTIVVLRFPVGALMLSVCSILSRLEHKKMAIFANLYEQHRNTMVEEKNYNSSLQGKMGHSAAVSYLRKLKGLQGQRGLSMMYYSTLIHNFIQQSDIAVQH